MTDELCHVRGDVYTYINYFHSAPLFPPKMSHLMRVSELKPV